MPGGVDEAEGGGAVGLGCGWWVGGWVSGRGLVLCGMCGVKVVCVVCEWEEGGGGVGCGMGGGVILGGCGSGRVKDKRRSGGVNRPPTTINASTTHRPPRSSSCRIPCPADSSIDVTVSGSAPKSSCSLCVCVRVYVCVRRGLISRW
jgi:hypothetical protein